MTRAFLLLAVLVLTALPAGAAPSDIPLYPGVTWKAQQHVPGGWRVQTVRTHALDGHSRKAATWYEDRMQALGWTSGGQVGAPGNWQIDYRKGKQACTVIFQAALRDNTDESDPAGPRIVIRWNDAAQKGGAR